MKTIYGHFINGEEVMSVSGETFEVENPATASTVCSVASGSVEDVQVRNAIHSF
jgi:acyl-CoA reductase-like NAD-dependent aldehyde dehydrogenase